MSARILLVVLGLLGLSMVPITPTIPRAHAAITGLVCIAPHGSASCPTVPATITAAKGTQLSLDVFVQGSDGMNGFDIAILADHTILRPVGVTMGGVLSNPSLLLVCIGGVQTWPPPNIITGFSCASSIDTADTIEMAASSAPGSPLTFPPTTGLLFTATYNVTGISTSRIPVDFQNGCSPSSVSGTTDCMFVANGSSSPVPETAQGAWFLTAQQQTLTLSFNRVLFNLVAVLANDTGNNLLVGTVQVTVTNQTTGQTIFSKSYTINVTFPGKNQIIPADRTLHFVLLAAGLDYGILCSSIPSTAPSIGCYATYNPDVYHYGQINILDVGALLLAYGSTPGSPHWNPLFDFDQDGYIGITDLITELLYYGSTIIA